MNCLQCRLDRKREAGFGLLEALVALVLLSSVGFALLAWVHQNLDAAHRLREFYAEQEARRVALEWIRSSNPMETPEGETMYGTLRITWKSTAISEAIPQIGYPQGIGRHEVSLYDTTLSVFRQGNDQVWLKQTVTTIGHRRSGGAPLNGP